MQIVIEPHRTKPESERRVDVVVAAMLGMSWREPVSL